MTAGSHKLAVCIVTQQLSRIVSGIGVYTNNVIRRLVADGQQICVVAPLNQRPAGDIPFRFVGVPAPVFGHNQARWISLAWHFGRILPALLQQSQFDLVHFTDAREALFYRAHTPALGNINDTYAADVRSLGYYRAYYADWLVRWAYYRCVHACEAWALRRLQAVVANSHHTATVVGARYHVPPGRLHTCPRSIDADAFADALQLREQSPRHAPRVLFVGGNMQRKGLPTLIRAARQILAVLPTTEFWVIGEDAARPQMEALCRNEGVAAHFRFLGWKPQAELMRIYAQADLFTMPSLTEAFGIVFLEAMAAGVPVVATCVGGIPEIVEDGVNGLLAPPDDPQALAHAIVRVLQEAALQERFRQAGLATARRFNIDRTMQCLYQVYQTVLSAGAPGLSAPGRRAVDD